MKVAEDAVQVGLDYRRTALRWTCSFRWHLIQVQAEVTAKVKKAMRERLFDGESYAAKHLH